MVSVSMRYRSIVLLATWYGYFYKIVSKQKSIGDIWISILCCVSTIPNEYLHMCIQESGCNNLKKRWKTVDFSKREVDRNRHFYTMDAYRLIYYRSSSCFLFRKLLNTSGYKIILSCWSIIVS